MCYTCDSLAHLPRNHHQSIFKFHKSSDCSFWFDPFIFKPGWDGLSISTKSYSGNETQTLMRGGCPSETLGWKKKKKKKETLGWKKLSPVKYVWWGFEMIMALRTCPKRSLSKRQACIQTVSLQCVKFHNRYNSN